MTATNTVDYSNCRVEDYSNSQSLKFLLGNDGAEKVYLREDLFYNLVNSRAKVCSGQDLWIRLNQQHPTPKITRQANRPESTF